MLLSQSKPHILKNATPALIRTYLKSSHLNELILIIHLKQNNENGPGWNRATTESFFQSCECSGKLRLIQMATGPVAPSLHRQAYPRWAYVLIYVDEGFLSIMRNSCLTMPKDPDLHALQRGRHLWGGRGCWPASTSSVGL